MAKALEIIFTAVYNNSVQARLKFNPEKELIYGTQK